MDSRGKPCTHVCYVHWFLRWALGQFPPVAAVDICGRGRWDVEESMVAQPHVAPTGRVRSSQVALFCGGWVSWVSDVWGADPAVQAEGGKVGGQSPSV